MAELDQDQIRRELDPTESQRSLATNIGEIARAQSKDRSFIVRMVVWVYAIGIGVCIGYAVLRGICCGNPNATADISEILKVAILPVLFLVIGYYFGTAKSN